MSNAMSRSKSRWKGALLAGAAIAAASPLAAKAATQTAGTMSLSLSLNPMGAVVNYGSNGTAEYIAPDQTVPIYVYATITEANNISTSPTATSNIAGLEYAYFNVAQNLGGSGTTSIENGSNTTSTGISITGINSSEGSIVGVQLNPYLGFSGAVGTQAGGTNYTAGIYAVGGTAMTNMAKPRANVPVWSTQSTYAQVAGTGAYGPYSVGSGDGTNVFVDGNSISFLLETLTYQPSFAPDNPHNTLTGNGVNTLTVQVPTLGTNYAGANYFTGETAVPSNTSVLNGSVGSYYTHTSYSASGYNAMSGASVAYSFSPTVTLYDAAAGDSLLEGIIDGDDVQSVSSAYGHYPAGYNNSTGEYNNNISGWTNGDFFDEGVVSGDDVQYVSSAYGGSYGPTAIGGSTFASPTAGIGGVSSVPEPGALGIVSLASLSLLRGRRGRKPSDT